MTTTRRRLTPPQIAETYGVRPEKVIGWIRAGELRAVNVATRANSRPRFVVDQDDLLAFEARRSATPAPKIRRRKQQRNERTIEFF